MNDIRLIFITNDPVVAKVCDSSGVDRIMVDLEIVGKSERQSGRNTLISDHNIDDISKIRKSISKSDLLVRINPLSHNTSSEIEAVLSAGADSIMLPMADSFSTVSEFSKIVDGRAKKVLLLETIPALIRADELCNKQLIDEVHIGLNDLHIDSRLSFMFEIMVSHVIDSLCELLKSKGIPFGIGGIAPIASNSSLSPKLVLSQHARLGSTQVILSRAFRDIFINLNNSHTLLTDAVNSIRHEYLNFLNSSDLDVDKNRVLFNESVKRLVRDST